MQKFLRRFLLIACVVFAVFAVGCTAVQTPNNNDATDKEYTLVLTQTALTVDVDEQKDLAPYILVKQTGLETTQAPKAISLSSQRTSKATVNGTVVTGIAEGASIITVTATAPNDKTLTGTITVTVVDNRYTVVVDGAPLAVEKNCERDVSSNVRLVGPTTVSNFAFTLTSSDTSKLVIDGTSIKGVAAASNVTVTVSGQDPNGKTVTGQFTAIVTDPNYAFTFDGKTLSTDAADVTPYAMRTEGSLTLDSLVKINPGNQAVTFSVSSSAPAVVSVAETTITAESVGTATITLTATGPDGDEIIGKFTVKVTDNTVTIPDLTVYVGYPKYIPATFAKETLALSYDYISSAFSINADGVITATSAAGATTVRAYNTASGVETTFKVTTKTNYDSPSSNDGNFVNKFNTRKNEVASMLNSNGAIAEHSVIWMGDSFFDDYFFKDFYTRFSGHNIVTVGVNSATTYELREWAGTLVHPYSPDALVLHIGTNDLWDCKDSAATVSANVISLISNLHAVDPEMKIYWFSIELRSGAIGGKSQADTVTAVKSVNSAVKAYLDGTTWGTYLDSYSMMTNTGTNPETIISANFLSDGVHPTLAAYDKYVKLLKDNGLDCNSRTYMDEATKGLHLVHHNGYGTADFNQSTGAYSVSYNGVKVNDIDRAETWFAMDGVRLHEGFIASGTATFTHIGSSAEWNWGGIFVGDGTNAWLQASNALPIANITFSDNKNEMWGYFDKDTSKSLTAQTDKTINFTVTFYQGATLFEIDGTKVYYAKNGNGNAAQFGIYASGMTVAGNVSIDFTTTNAKTAMQTYVDSIVHTTPIDDKSYADTVKRADNDWIKTNMSANAIISGKIDITDKQTNAHIGFEFADYDDRFLIWDNNNDGTFGLGWAFPNHLNETHAPTEDLYKFTAGQTLTLNWKVVLYNDNIYFYLSEGSNALELKAIYKNHDINSNLSIYSEETGCKFYDMEVLSKANDETGFNNAISALSADMAKANSLTTGIHRV